MTPAFGFSVGDFISVISASTSREAAGEETNAVRLGKED
jgi:hypothetical protein